jgi:ABC-type uncharacterized transport system auxiliary subunit
MKNLAVAFVGALMFTGCGSVRYPATYILNFPPPAPKAEPSEGTLGPVAIRELQCPEYLCEGRIVYRSSREEVGFYEYHRWALNPRQAITQYLIDSVQAQSLFKGVAVHDCGSDAAYLLTGAIKRLEEVDQDHDVRVVCTISAQLLDTRMKSVVWSHTASETVQVEKRDIRGVVSSLASASRAAVDRLLKSMVEELPALRAGDFTPKSLLHQPGALSPLNTGAHR